MMAETADETTGEATHEATAKITAVAATQISETATAFATVITVIEAVSALHAAIDPLGETKRAGVAPTTKPKTSEATKAKKKRRRRRLKRPFLWRAKNSLWFTSTTALVPRLPCPAFLTTPSAN